MIAFDISHLHPMLVHFPIALLLVGFLTEIAALVYKKETHFAQFSFYLLLLGTLAIIVTWLSGALFTPHLEGAAGELRETHEHVGMAATILAIVTLAIRLYQLRQPTENALLQKISVATYALAALLVALAGALGGNLVHGNLMPM